jgi:hypothetical protein
MDIQQFLFTTSDNTTMTSDLSGSLNHGATVYSTVVCSNRGGLFSSAYTDGVTILYQPPSADEAYVSITSPSYVQYPSRGGYLPTPALIVQWDGFAESAGTPLLYEVQVQEGDGMPLNWTGVSTAKALLLSDLELSENTTHMIQIRAVNLGGMASDPVGASFFIASDTPEDTGTCLW